MKLGRGWRSALAGGLVAVAAGAATMAALPANAVVGGTGASTQDYPYVVTFRLAAAAETLLGLAGQDVPKGFCDGTLVTPTKVLTAGHCVEFMKLAQSLHLSLDKLVFAIASRDDLSNKSAGAEAPVRSVWLHPDFSKTKYLDDYRYRNDVGVVTLTKPLGSATAPIAAAGQTSLYQAGTPARIIGWGATGDQKTDAGILHTATVSVVADADCASPESYGSLYDAAQGVCAGRFDEGGVDTCEYDSGSPLLIDGVVAGITSWGNGCGKPKFPGVYTRVTTFSDVIRAQIGS